MRAILAPFFQIAEGLWRHKRVEFEKKDADSKHAKKVAAGKAGAEAKWSQNDKQTDGVANSGAIAPPEPPHKQTDAPITTTSTSTLPSGEEKISSAVIAEFDEWYRIFPRRQGRKAALKAFIRARKTVDLATLNAAVFKYIATKPSYQDFCMPATWLNEERWLDEPHQQANGAATTADASFLAEVDAKLSGAE